MVNSHKSVFSIIVFILTLTIALSSCKLKAEQKSLTLQFEVIDSMISDGDFKSAIKELKRTEKIAYDSWSYIGIYKRYAQMGEDKRSEKLLKKALKKNSHNQELLAVYTSFLLRHDRIDEAARKGEELQGGKYGSLYSEAVLRIERNKVSAQDNPDYYKDPKFYQIYLDAYKADSDSMWLRNCAVYHLNLGYYEQAASLNPVMYSDVDDAYFWAMVLFDAGRYYDSASAIKAAKTYLQVYPNRHSGKREHPSQIQLVALESDAFMAVSEVDMANDVRKEITENLDEITLLNQADEEMLKMITANTVIYANNTQNRDSAYDVLIYMVNQWPTFQDGLSLYSKFAYESNQMRDETSEEKTLREIGLQSLSMERFDSRKIIPIEDAVYRLDKALELEKNPYLEIVKLDLKYKLDGTYTEKQKTADLWNILEKNYSEEEKFNPLLVQYALSYLLKTGQYDDAYTLFYKFMVATYNFESTDDFWTQVHGVLTKMDVKMAEFASYFAARQNLYDETFRFYEYCVFETGGSQKEMIVSPYVSSSSCMNLADAYYSVGKKETALELYGKTSGRESSNYLRSQIHCRIALIYAGNGDKKNALRSIEYANSVYPGNARANLIKEQIK